jgi:hypothetical protein
MDNKRPNQPNDDALRAYAEAAAKAEYQYLDADQQANLSFERAAAGNINKTGRDHALALFGGKWNAGLFCYAGTTAIARQAS